MTLRNNRKEKEIDRHSNSKQNEIVPGSCSPHSPSNNVTNTLAPMSATVFSRLVTWSCVSRAFNLLNTTVMNDYQLTEIEKNHAYFLQNVLESLTLAVNVETFIVLFS